MTHLQRFSAVSSRQYALPQFSMRKLFLMMKEIDLPHRMSQHWKRWQALNVTRLYLPLLAVPSWNRTLSDLFVIIDHPSSDR